MEGPAEDPHCGPGGQLRTGAWLLASAAFLGTAAFAQQKPTVPDQVFAMNNRGATVTHTGTVTKNGLDDVRIEGRERPVRSDTVQRIVWGDVPPAYKDGQTYLARREYEKAVSSFRIAATDADSRDVVKGSARLLSASALLHLGAKDPNRFQQSVEEVDRFLQDYPNNRETPDAHALKARGTWLSGQPKEAGDLYRVLFDEGKSDPPTTGYRKLDCLEAGLAAGRAFIAAGESLTAREVFTTLERSARDHLAALDPADSSLQRIEQLEAEAQLGEGYALLASGQMSQAITFFESRKPSAIKNRGTQRFGVSLGLAEALFASDRKREAQIHFAEVSALDYVDRDRVARALVGQAQCSIDLQDKDSSEAARALLQEVLSAFGDTPSSAKAAEMLEKL